MGQVRRSIDRNFLIQDRFQPAGDQLGTLHLKPSGELIGSLQEPLFDAHGDEPHAFADLGPAAFSFRPLPLGFLLRGRFGRLVDNEFAVELGRGFSQLLGRYIGVLFRSLSYCHH